MAFDVLSTLAIDIIVNTRRAAIDLRGMHHEMKGMSAQAQLATRGVLGFAVASAVFSGVNAVLRVGVDLIKESVLAYADLEQSIINIETIASFDNFEEKQVELLDTIIQLRIEHEKFAAIAMSGARSGFRGEELDALVDASVKLSRVAQDLGDRDAAEGLAALSANLNFDGDILNLASAVDILSDNFKVTTGEVLKSSSRLSGFASAVGITQAELLALVTVLLDAKATATTTRSTIQNFFKVLISEPEKVREQAQLTSEEYDRLTDSTTNALEKMTIFFIALNRLDSGEQFKALDELGLGSARVGANLAIIGQRIAEAEGGFSKFDQAAQLVNDELERGTNIIIKHDKQVSTMNAKITEMEQRWIQTKAALADNKSILASFAAIHGAVIRLNEAFGKPDFAAGNGLDNIQTAEQANERMAQLKELIRLHEEEIEKLKEKAKWQGIISSILFFSPIGPFIAGSQATRFSFAGTQVSISEATSSLEEHKRVLKEILEIYEKLEKSPQLNIPTIEESRQTMQDFAYQQYQGRTAGMDYDTGTIEHGRRALEEADRAHKDFAKHREEEAERFRELAKEKFEAAADKAAGVLGKPGEVLTTIKRFQEIIEMMKEAGVGGPAAFALERIKGKALDDLINPPDPAPQFKGLTQAWKDAQVSTKKEDLDLLRDQIEVAEAIAAKADEAAGVRKQMNDALQDLRKRKGLAIK